MKMTNEHYATLAAELPRGIAAIPALSDYLAAGYTARRWRFDAIYAATRKNDTMQDWYSEIYRYCNDDHIDTAMRAITNTK